MDTVSHDSPLSHWPVVREVTKHIKKHLHVERGTGGMVTVKPFAEGQKWSEMLGYIQKDMGKSTFSIVTHNVTDTELAQVSQIICCLLSCRLPSCNAVDLRIRMSVSF